MAQLALPTATSGVSPFDAIRRVDADGEHWLARDLMVVVGYEKWERFADAVERAIISIDNAYETTGESAGQHVSRLREPSGRTNQIRHDYRLTRHGAYMTAMNGDVRKQAIADAQAYFAARTRQAEIAEQNRNLPQMPTTLTEALRFAADQIEARERVIAELEPKAAQADHHRAADDLVPVGDFANKIKAWAKREHNVRIKHEQVWVFLADIGLLIRGNTLRHNQPTAFATDKDFVRVKTTEFETNTRGLQASTSPRLTADGEGWAWDRAVKRIAAHGSLSAPTKAIEGATK